MKIGTNTHALQAYSALNRSNKKLISINARLTTGRKINSSADDPSVLTTASKLSMQINGYGKAHQNSSNAISLLQTADGALNTIQSMAQRMRELAVQASNETNSADDRAKMQEEINQLKSEIDETIRKAEYNGIRLLNGDASKLEYKYTNETASSPTKLTLGAPTLGTLPNDKLFGDIILTATNLTGASPLPVTINLDGTETEPDIWAKFNAACSAAGFSLTGTSPELGSIVSNTDGSNIKLVVSGDDFLLNSLGLTPFSGATYERGKNIGINLITQAEDPRSPLSDEAMLTQIGVNSYTITDNKFSAAANGFVTKTTIDPSGLIPGEVGIINDISTQPFVVQIGAGKGVEMDISIAKISSEILGADRVNLLSTEFAVNSIKLLDKIISDISEIRTTVGAYQNRLEFTLSSLEVGKDKLEISLSRLWDTDMAVEMSEFAQQSVIVQASLSVIAQSNQRPSEVISLLRK